MAADLKGLRSAMELMAEQVSKLVALGGQQIDAVARLAPLITQSAEGITDRSAEVVSAVGSIPSSIPLPIRQNPSLPKSSQHHNLSLSMITITQSNRNQSRTCSGGRKAFDAEPALQEE
jgi:hypothetical protein